MGIHGGAAREAVAVRDRLLRVSEAKGLKVEESVALGVKLRQWPCARFSDQRSRESVSVAANCLTVSTKRGV